MPTEFTRATEQISELESIVKNYNSNDINSFDYQRLDELNRSLVKALQNFTKRIENQLYNNNMIIKVNDLIKRNELLTDAIKIIKDDYEKYNIQENEKKRKQEEYIAIEKQVKVENEEKKKHENVIEENSNNVIEENSNNKVIVESSLERIPSLPRRLSSNNFSEKRRLLSETYATNLITSIAKTLQIDLNAGLNRNQVKDIVNTILVSKMSNSNYEHAEGWSRWFEIETEAAFILMDTDGSGFISIEELIIFASQHPQMFGPISHIERLFTSFDTNDDGIIDGEELFTLLLEVELELSCEEPNLDEINSKTVQYMAYYDRNKDQGLTLLEFIRLVFAHPELLGNACMMRMYFKQADLNNDDKLDKNEIHEMMKKFLKNSGLPLPPDFDEMIQNILNDADKDKDGFVDYTEFMEYFIRNPNRVELFNILLNFSKDLNPYEDSCYKDLCNNQSNSLGYTDPKNPQVDYCCNCNCPLIGLKMGISKFGRSFCNNTCVSSFDGLVEEKAAYLSKFCKADFRALTHDDYSSAGVFGNSWRRYTRRY